MPNQSPLQKPRSRAGRATARGRDELATIAAIRQIAAEPASPPPDVLNDLALLRRADDDLFGAVACLRVALEADSSCARTRTNLAALDAYSESLLHWRSSDAACETGAATLNPWVLDALQAAERAVGLSGKRVLEIGGSVPPGAVRQIGVEHWTACDLAPAVVDADDCTTLTADARTLPLESASIDAAYSVCAFEHFDRLAEVLAEAHRVLRPGARLFTQFAPIWSCPVGHHVWLMERGQPLVTFNDQVIPRWAHLLLEEHELRAFLTITRGAELARTLTDYVWRDSYVNRLFEGDFRRIVEESAFDVVTYESWGGSTRPEPRLADELAARWPQGGDFATHGLRIVLRK